MQRDLELEPGNHPGGWNLQTTYTRLPDGFFQDVLPARVSAPALFVFNDALAAELGLTLGQEPPETVAAVLAGQTIPPGARPIAQAYAGHQFGGFTILGDGRAILLGEQRTPDGRLVDIQFKGSGQTPYSRRGDGRAALGPMLREYIISEAMHSLRIPTTRSLAVVTTGERVVRESLLQGAILTRIAASHIRVGTFQFAATRQETDQLRALVNYAIDRHDPEIAANDQLSEAEKCLRFLQQVISRQVDLITQWQMVGFVHGVMNTDNMVISGETIDYGPCAFLDVYHPEMVFSSIDQHGRYAYANQPAIGQWNLARFAETLLPLLHDNTDTAIELATGALNDYAAQYDHQWLQGMRKKLGLQTELDEDRELVTSLLNWMQTAERDFTNTFDDLSQAASVTNVPEASVYQDAVFRAWHERWRQRLEQEGSSAEVTASRMQKVNPCRIPRNHRVEAALSAAVDGDPSVMHQLLQALAAPYERDPQFADYRNPPPADQPRYRTFCGT